MKWITLILCLILPTSSFAVTVEDNTSVTVEGNTYKESVTVAGHQLKLIGTGLREIYGFNVYTIAVYSQSGECNESEMVDSEQIKYLRLDILRNIDADKVANRIEEAFGENMPSNASPKLIKQRDQSFSYFNGRCTKGTVFEFIYLPGKGTIFKQDGKALGPTITGKEYHTVFWNVYFGPNTCCPDLKDQLLVKCKPQVEPEPFDPLKGVYN